MKRIAAFAKALAQIRQLCSQADYAAAENEMQHTCRDFTGLNLAEVEAIDHAAFTEKIIRSIELDELQLKMLADLLYEKLTLCLKSDEKVNREDLSQKCRALYILVSERSPQVYDLEVRRRLDYLDPRNQL